MNDVVEKVKRFSVKIGAFDYPPDDIDDILEGIGAEVEKLERENRWMAAEIGDKRYDAMREAMLFGGEDE